jgi:23S rRNA pseudouridine1911/1915/1917 synthase
MKERPGHPTLAAIVREQTGAAWSRAKQLCLDGRVTVDGERCTDPAARVSPGAEVVVNQHAPKAVSGPLAAEAIVYVDPDLVVVNKPAGMLSVADEPGNNETLVNHTRTLLRRLKAGDAALAVVHRLDRDTSGLLVFARNATALRHLAVQFRDHTVERTYEGIAHGVVMAARMDTMLILDRGDGLRGSFGHFRRARGAPPPDARQAITEITPLGPLRGATHVECRLETGRQHQIRIHLAEMGSPLVGERVYIRDYKGPKIDAERPMLHARLLGFVHPRTGEAVRYEREAPDDFALMLQKLR